MPPERVAMPQAREIIRLNLRLLFQRAKTSRRLGDAKSAV
jgi:hypothetical protein